MQIKKPEKGELFPKREREKEKERKDTNEKVRKEMSIVKNDGCVFFRLNDYSASAYLTIRGNNKWVNKQKQSKIRIIIRCSFITRP